MKQFKLVAALLLLFYSSFAQVVNSTSSALKLIGNGKLSPTKDEVKLFRYNDSIPSSYTYSALFRSVSNKKAAVGISFRNEGTRTDGKLAAVHVLLQNDSLKVLYRNVNNGTANIIYSKPNITLPAYLKAEVDNLGLSIYYTKNLKGVGFKKLYQNDNIFQNWSTRRPNIINPVSRVVTTGEVYNVALVKKNPTDASIPSNYCGCNGVADFDLESVHQNSNTTIVNMSFRSCNAYSLKWEVLNTGGTVLKTGNIIPTSGLISADVGNLTTGSYTMRLTAQSCVGTDTGTFAYTAPSSGGGTTTPPDTSIPNSTSSYTNLWMNIPLETANDTFSPELWPNVQVPQIFDSYLGRDIPTFFVSTEMPQSFFVKIDQQLKGIWTSNNQYNLQPCLDRWPNIAWENDCPGKSFETFVSRVPGTRRGFFQYPNSSEYYDTQPLLNIYNDGYSRVGNYGLGDQINGRANVFCSSLDVEISQVTGASDQDGNKMRALSKGMSDRIAGFNIGIYLSPLFTYGNFNWARYPTKPDGTYDYPKTSGNPMLLTFNGQSLAINTLFGMSGPSGDQSNWHIKDTKNFLSCEALEGRYEWGLNEGEELRDAAGNLKHVVKHFGTQYDATGATGYNVQHALARVIHLTETDAYFGELQGRKVSSMFKCVQDAGGVGELAGYVWNDHTKYNADEKGSSRGYFPRHLMFEGGLNLFFSGVYNWHVWDLGPVPGSYMDGYNGVMGAINYIFRKINVGGQDVSLASLRPNLKFQRWKTEISYDGGSTWVTHNGIELRENPNRLPVRIAYTNDGYICVLACRPFLVEPQACKWRVSINGTTYTGDITSSDWQSCYPNDPNRKDFYLNIIKAF